MVWYLLSISIDHKQNQLQNLGHGGTVVEDEIQKTNFMISI